MNRFFLFFVIVSFGCNKSNLEISLNDISSKDIYITDTLEISMNDPLPPIGCEHLYIESSIDTITKYYLQNNTNPFQLFMALEKVKELYVDCIGLIEINTGYDEYFPFPTPQVGNYTIPIMTDELSCAQFFGSLKTTNSPIPNDDNLLVSYLRVIKNVFELMPGNYYSNSSIVFNNFLTEVDNLGLDGTLMMPPFYGNPYLNKGFLISIASNYRVPYYIATQYLTRPIDPIIITDEPIPIGGTLPDNYYELWDGILVEYNN